MVWGLFIGVNSYPLLLIGNLLLGNKFYKRNKILGYSILTWPILIFALLATEREGIEPSEILYFTVVMSF